MSTKYNLVSKLGRTGDWTSEEALVIAIMNQAVLDKDTRYFKEELFDIHCALLGVDADLIRWEMLARIEG